MKKILFILLLATGILSVYALAPFSSPNIGYNPVVGYILQTNGATSTWVATSSLGISGGSGTVTSVSVNTPIGLTASTSTCNTACLITLALQSGYNIPLNASTTNWNNFYNASATLPYYLTFSYASSSFPSFTYASSTYYLASNPNGYITNSVSNLTNYPNYSYGSSTYYFASNPSGYITSSALTPYIPFSYASSTFVPFSYGSTTYYLATNPSNYISLGSLSALYPIIYNSGTGQFSTGFSTSTNNVFTNLNTFNASTTLASSTIADLLVSGKSLLVGNSSTTNGFSVGGKFFFSNASGTGLTGTDLYGVLHPTGITNSWISVDTTGKIIATSAPATGSGFFATTSINGLATTTFIFSTTSDTNIGLAISTSSTGILFTPQWIGTLADGRISSASTWNAKLSSLFDVASGTGLTIGNLFSTSSLRIFGTLRDSTNASGTAGQVLSSTGTSTLWTTPTGGGEVTYAYGSSTYVAVIGNQTVAGNKTFTGTTTLASTTLSGPLADITGTFGTSGQVLQSTGTSTKWVTNSASGLSGSGTNGLVARFTDANTLSNGVLFDNGIVAGVNATSSSYTFNVQGSNGVNPFNVSSSTGSRMVSINQDGRIDFATTTATTTDGSGTTLGAKSFANFNVLTLKNPLDRIDTPLQSAFWSKNVVWRTPGIVAAGLCENTVCTNAGTAALVLPTVTNAYTAMRRTTFATVVTTQNQQVGVRTQAMFFRGTNQAVGPYLGGFFFAARVGLTTWTANNRLFVGMSTCTTACVTATTTLQNLTNTVGFGVEAGTSQIVFLTNDASGVISTTTISGQPALAANQGYDMYIYAPADRHEIHWRIDNASTSAIIATGTVRDNLPATTTLLLGHAQIGNGPNTTVGAATLGVGKIYIESER